MKNYFNWLKNLSSPLSVDRWLLFLFLLILPIAGYCLGLKAGISHLSSQIEQSYLNQPIRPNYPLSAPITEGIASWYDYELDGNLWSADHLTAASRDFPRYSYVKVTNKSNNKSVIVYINDYGPAEWTNRAIDLSSHAFSQISNLKRGLIEVSMQLVSISDTSNNY